MVRTPSAASPMAGRTVSSVSTPCPVRGMRAARPYSLYCFTKRMAAAPAHHGGPRVGRGGARRGQIGGEVGRVERRVDLLHDLPAPCLEARHEGLHRVTPG